MLPSPLFYTSKIAGRVASKYATALQCSINSGTLRLANGTRLKVPCSRLHVLPNHSTIRHSSISCKLSKSICMISVTSSGRPLAIPKKGFSPSGSQHFCNGNMPCITPWSRSARYTQPGTGMGGKEMSLTAYCWQLSYWSRLFGRMQLQYSSSRRVGSPIWTIVSGDDSAL
jgi:hypothetical protein